MNLKMLVVFSFMDHDEYVPAHRKLDNINQLKDYIAGCCQANQKKIHKIEIIRDLCLINLDEGEKRFMDFNQDSIDGHKVLSRIEDGKITLITPQYYYPKDVRKLLKKEYGSVLNFNPADEKKPGIYTVYEHTSRGLMNQKTFCPCINTWNDVSWKPLTTKDIVVDKNCNQIWPTATKQPPIGLIELLSKKTEKVY